MKNIKISNIFDHLDEWQKVTKTKTKELPEDVYSFIKFYILESNSIKKLTNQKFYNYKAIELSYAVSDETSVNAGYHQNSAETFKANNTYGVGEDSVGIWEVGFNTKLGQDWSLDANYFKSNQDKQGAANTAVEDTGMFTQIKYKAADIKTEGSYDVFLNYRKVPTNTQIAQTWGDYADNNKGWALGFDYVPAENVNFQAFYFDGKDVDDSNVKTKFVRAEVELFF